MNKDEVDYSLKGRCGVYLLEINGVKYVGSSVNLYRRINDHKNHLKRRVHKNRHMQNAWNKYKELKGRVAPNKTPHKLIDLKTGEVYKSDSLSELSKIAPISLSSIVRIKNGTIGKKLKGKYKLEW